MSNLNDVLNEIEEYLDGRADADEVVGSVGPQPNEEMSLLTKLQDARGSGTDCDKAVQILSQFMGRTPDDHWIVVYAWKNGDALSDLTVKYMADEPAARAQAADDHPGKAAYEKIERQFTSGNSVKVREAVIQKYDWSMACAYLRNQMVFSDSSEDIEERLKHDLENSCPACGGSGHKDDCARPEPSSGVPEGLREVVEALGPEDPMFGIDYQDKMATYHCQYCSFGIADFGPTPSADRIKHDDDCPVVALRALLTAAPTPEAVHGGGVPEEYTVQAGAQISPHVREHLEKAVKDLYPIDTWLIAKPSREELTRFNSLLNLVKDVLALPATHPHTNQPDSEQGGEWVRCDERLPTEGRPFLCWYSGNGKTVTLMSAEGVRHMFATGNAPDAEWMCAGIKKPQPPKSKEE